MSGDSSVSDLNSLWNWGDWGVSTLEGASDMFFFHHTVRDSSKFGRWAGGQVGVSSDSNWPVLK